jgi:hypothetical protein
MSPERSEGPISTSTHTHKLRRTLSPIPVFYEVIDDDAGSDLELEVDDSNPARPKVVIDHDYFPHIMDAILEDVSFETLLAFRATSTSYRNRVDRDLAHITITERDAKPMLNSYCDMSGVVVARTKQGYTLWSLPIRNHKSSIQRAKDVFSIFARFHSSRNVTITIDLIGDPDMGVGMVSSIFFAALGDGIKGPKQPSPRTRFRIFPDSNGTVRVHGHGWDGPRILMDSWKALRSHNVARTQKEFVISISGRECSRLSNACIPNGSTVGYDFTTWKPVPSGWPCGGNAPTNDRNADMCDTERPKCDLAVAAEKIQNPLMASFINHIVNLLVKDCVVYIFGLQLVDRQWLDPFYVSGKAWSHSPAGSKPEGQQLPLATYIRNSVIRAFNSNPGLEDLIEDLDMYFNIMGLRYSWQSYCNW